MVLHVVDMSGLMSLSKPFFKAVCRVLPNIRPFPLSMPRGVATKIVVSAWAVPMSNENKRASLYTVGPSEKNCIGFKGVDVTSCVKAGCGGV